LPTTESSFNPSLRFTSFAIEFSVWNCVLVEPPLLVLEPPVRWLDRSKPS
jgi:hypothetical protein